MYGSSLRIETLRPRALSRRPMLAAVMPLPREEVTPPVTKTYFAMGRILRGFFQCYRIRGAGTTRNRAYGVAGRGSRRAAERSPWPSWIAPRSNGRDFGRMERRAFQGAAGSSDGTPGGPVGGRGGRVENQASHAGTDGRPKKRGTAPPGA